MHHLDSRLERRDEKKKEEEILKSKEREREKKEVPKTVLQTPEKTDPQSWLISAAVALHPRLITYYLF